MSEVLRQAYIFFCSCVCGIIIAFIYDLFRIIRKTFKTRALMVYFEDLLYWVVVAIATFLVIYYNNDGEIRAYVFLGMIIGIFVYSVSLSSPVRRTLLWVVNAIKKVFYKGDAILNGLQGKICAERARVCKRKAQKRKD